jgi:Zn-dependent protease with chaperone function
LIVASVILLALSVLTGCATVRHVGVVLTTPEQRAAYQADLVAAQRVCDYRKLTPCPLLRIRVAAADHLSGHVAGGIFPNGEIMLNQRLYEPGAERYRKAVLAHEFAHVLLGHARDPRCRPGSYSPSDGYNLARRHACEFEADAHSVAVLDQGWGMERAAAINLVYSKLLLRVDVTEALGSHAAGCEEILSFARAFRLAVPKRCVA